MDAISLNSNAKQCLDEGNFSTAITYFSMAVEILSKEGRNKSCADLYNNIGHAHVKLGNFDDAIKAFTVAAHIYEDLMDYIDLGKQLANIGTVYRDKRKYDLALEYYNKAMALFQEHEPECQLDIADQNSNIGYILVMQKDIQNALQHFEKAKELYLKLGAKQKEDLVDINIKALMPFVGEKANARC